jgi:hypothetical protein
MNTKSNENKKDQLGMPFGTAANRLRKMIMLWLLQQLDKNLCFRCGKKIESPEDLSIDHIESWMDKDPNLFWDLDNIAFSHLKCNSAARRKSGGPAKMEIPAGKAWCYACQKFVDEKIVPNNRTRWHGKQDICNPCRKIKREKGIFKY